MINVIIYLPAKHDPVQLVANLLEQKLIANASIDKDNVSYRFDGSSINAVVETVITAQTKAMLFSQIDTLVKEKHGDNVPVFSQPITQTNPSFDALIRNHTLKV